MAIGEEIEVPQDYPTGSPGSFSPLPDGNYKVKIVKSGRSETKEKKLPLFKVEMVVIFGPYKSRKVWANLVLLPFFKDKAKKEFTPGAGIILSFLRAIGEPHKGKFAIDHENWVGKELGVRLYSEPYNGKLQNKVGTYMTLDEFAANMGGGLDEQPKQLEEEVPF